MTDRAPALGVGMVGYAFMGAVHSQAWRTAGRFFDLPLAPAMTALCGRDAGGRGSCGRADGLGVGGDRLEAADRRGTTSSWSTSAHPGDTHAEIAIAALEAGKHVLCEKPLANTVEEAEAMVEAAEAAEARGVRSMVAFNYRRVPAIALARKLVAGRPARHRSATCGRSTSRTGSSTRRSRWCGGCRRTSAGSGALGDIGAHIIDLAQYVVGAADHRRHRSHRDLRPASARCPRRPRAWPRPVARAPVRSRSTTPRCSSRGSTRGRIGSFEATRFASGRKNAMRLEINGSRGQHRLRLRVDERAAVPRPHRGCRDGRLPADPGHRAHPSVRSRPGGRPVTAWATSTRSPTRWSTWSRPSATGRPPAPSFADGLQVQRVLAAVERSAAHDSGWERVGDLGDPGKPADLSVAQQPA